MDSFARLVPRRDDFATAPIRDGFDWDGAVGGLEDFRAYLVVFRSVRRDGADVKRLIAHDDLAHDEARRSEGFIHYFKGSVESGRSCLSFCLWENRNCAVAAAGRDFHQRAAGIVDEMYETYELERYDLYRNTKGSLVFAPMSVG